MSEQKGFFGNIFDSTEDDPLLQSDSFDDDASGNEAASPSNTGSSLFSPDASPPADARRDSPASASGDTARRFSSTPTASEHDDYQTVVLEEATDPWTNDTTWEGLDALNDAVQTGWHVVDIEPSHEPSDAPLQLSILLERDIPRSLFDFGGPM